MTAGRELGTGTDTIAGANSGYSRLTEHLVAEWDATYEDLSRLAEEEDKLVAEGREIPEALEQEIDEAYAYQRKILLDALSVRSETLQDIKLKLEIWQSHTFGKEKVKPHLMQPSDLLIRQTIRELSELMK